MNRVSLNALWLFIARAISQGLALVFTILIARNLGEAGLGQYAFIAAVVFVGNTLSTFGMDTLLIREIAAQRRADTPTLTAALLIQLTLSTLFILAVQIGANWLPNQSSETATALKWVSLSLLPLAFATVYSAALRGYERMDLVMAVNVGTAVLQTGGAFIIFRNGGSLIHLAWLLLTVPVMGAMGYAWLCTRFLPGFAYNWQLTHPILRQTARTGASLAFLMILAVIYQRLGVFGLSLLADDAATGQFSAAARIVEAVKMVPYAFFGALFPVMARQPQRAQKTQRIDGLFWGLAGFTAVSALTLTLFANPLIHLLYGTGYAPSTAALQILGWSLIPFTITLKLSFELVAGGQEKVALRAMMWTMGVTAVLFTLLIQRWGLSGAAWAVTIGETMQASILWKMRNVE